MCLLNFINGAQTGFDPVEFASFNVIVFFLLKIALYFQHFFSQNKYFIVADAAVVVGHFEKFTWEIVQTINIQ